MKMFHCKKNNNDKRVSTRLNLKEINQRIFKYLRILFFASKMSLPKKPKRMVKIHKTQIT